MRVTEKMTSDNAIFNINKSQNRLNQLNELLSSNQNINRPSDDPIGTRQILDMQSQVRSIDQYMNNIQNGQTWTSVATIALQGMNDFLTQAKAAASNILGGTNDSVSVSNTLATLENVRQQMIDLANVQVGDQYVFGGFNNATPVVSNKKLSGVVDVSKSPNQIAFSDTSGLIVGMTVSGAGIQPETTITAIDTINKVVTISKNPLSTKSGFDYTFGLPPTSQKGNTSFTANQSQITGINTTGLSVGDQVTGPGVTLGNTILSIDSAGQVTLAQPLTKATIGGVFNFVPRIYQTGDTAAGTSTITNLPSTAGFRVGSAVTGPGVPAGTTIASVDIAGPGGQVTLSQNITQTVTGGTFAFTPTLIRTGNSGTISTLFATAAIATPTTISNVDTTVLNVGGTVTGPGVPPGTTILAINGATNQITISNAITQDVSTGGDFTFTSSLNVIKGLDTTNLGVGDTVTGPGIPAGTTIFSVDSASQITLSAPMTSAVSGGIFSFTPAVGPAVGTQSGNTSFSSSQVTGLDTTNLLTGMTISGPGVQSGTTIASIDSTSQITLSNPLTKVTTGGTFIFLPTTTKTVAGTGGTTNLSNQLAGLANVTGLAVGMSISGAGLPVNTIITKIDTSIPAAPVIYLNNNATQTTAGGTYTFGPTVTKAGTTNPPNQITGLPLAQLQNLYIGMKVTGPGVPDNTTITDIDTTDKNGTGSVTLSNSPAGPGGAGQFIFEGYIDSYGDRSMMGTVTTGSSSISGLPSTTNMVNAPAVSKTGSTNPSVNPNQITGLADTNGLTIGMPITDNAGGTIIAPNTIITEIDPVAKRITLSNPFIPPATKTGTTDGIASQISGIDTTNLFVGMSVSGTGIPANTIITATPTSVPPSSGANNITLSNTPALAAPAGTLFSFAPTTLKTTTDVSFNFSQPISKTGATTPLTKLITGLADTNNLFVGMPVTDNTGGTIIPANTIITAIDSLAKTITLSNTPVLAPTGTKFFFSPTMPKAGATVAAVNQITGIVDTTNLFVGMPVTGPGIPANTTITATPTSVPASTANTITLSNNPTITAAYGTFFFGQYSAMTVAGTGVTPNPSLGAIVNSNSVNLAAAAATATSPIGGTELTFTGHFATEDIKVNINKSSQVALNYSVSKLLLGGAPPATTQGSGPPPSTLPVNILGTIGELITAIQNKDDAGVIAAASNLKTATDQVNLAQTEYAGRTIRLDSAQTMLTNNQNTLKNIISSKQTLDTAKTIIQLQQQTTAYQAALQGTAKILPISLMDYLR